jgi:hypothetical protein
MSGSTLTACDTWATLNVLQLQKSCPLRDLNLRPLEQNWSVLTTKKRINLCYIGAFTSFYQWNAINAINKPKLQKKLPLWDLNLRPFEQNWSALTTKTRINLCYIGVFTSFYQWNTINPVNKPKLQKSCPLKDLNLRPLGQNWSALTTKTKSHLCYIGVFTSFYQWNAINPINKPKLQKSCSLKDLNHRRPLEQNRSVLTSRTSISFCCIRLFYFFFIN